MTKCWIVFLKRAKVNFFPNKFSSLLLSFSFCVIILCIWKIMIHHHINICINWNYGNLWFCHTQKTIHDHIFQWSLPQKIVALSLSLSLSHTIIHIKSQHPMLSWNKMKNWPYSLLIATTLTWTLRDHC